MQVQEGEIDPFCSVKLPVIFSPVIPGEVKADFKVMFKNQQCPAVSIHGHFLYAIMAPTVSPASSPEVIAVSLCSAQTAATQPWKTALLCL